MEPWIAKLDAGDAPGAWDLFVERYRRLLFAAIRHYTTDHDDVMDVFAHVCEALRTDDLARLRRRLVDPDPRARLSTWLVTVVRHLTVDWFRHRDGRRRLAAVAATLPPLQQRIFEHVFLGRHSHVAAYELIRTAEAPDLPFGRFLRELAATYRAVTAGRRGNVLRELGGRAPPAEGDPPPDPAAACERGEAVRAALAPLPAEERVAIELYVVDGLPAAEVARIVGFPNAKAVYNRVYRALAEVRERLEHAGIRREDL